MNGTLRRVDVVIVGGGLAGLWLLNVLRGRGYGALLLEAQRLGGGQSLASQGIIHGGLKYALGGKYTPASEALAGMPERWRACLAGKGEVDLRGIQPLSEHGYLFAAGGLGKLTAFFAAKGLRGRIEKLARRAYPPALQADAFQGQVYRTNDLTLDPSALVARLAVLGAGHICRRTLEASACALSDEVRIDLTKMAQAGESDGVRIGLTKTAQAGESDAVRVGLTKTAQAGESDEVRVGLTKTAQAGESDEVRVDLTKAAHVGESDAVRVDLTKTAQAGESDGVRIGLPKLAQAGESDGVRIELTKPGHAGEGAATGGIPALAANRLILAAGAGNEALLRGLGIEGIAMQRRPLHQVVVRRDCLPPLFGHCLSGLHSLEPRLTITSHPDGNGAGGSWLWQLGGQLATDGVRRSSAEQRHHARRELEAHFPWMDWAEANIETYRIDRAEPRQPGGRRPDEAFAAAIGPCILCWPTKLALIPDLADRVLKLLPPPCGDSPMLNLPAPEIGAPPWKA